MGRSGATAAGPSPLRTALRAAAGFGLAGLALSLVAPPAPGEGALTLVVQRFVVGLEGGAVGGAIYGALRPSVPARGRAGGSLCGAAAGLVVAALVLTMRLTRAAHGVALPPLRVAYVVRLVGGCALAGAAAGLLARVPGADRRATPNGV